MVAPAAAALGLAFTAASANASPNYRLSVSPKTIKPGGKVIVQTTPRRSCALQITIHGSHFEHSMKYGWVKISLPRKELTGSVAVKTTCAGVVAHGSFTIRK